MNKKISTELAIGLILLLALIVGVSFWFLSKKDISKVEPIKISLQQNERDSGPLPVDLDLDVRNKAQKFLNYLGTEKKSGVFIDCQKDDDCYFAPEITNICSRFSININNSKEDIADYNLKSTNSESRSLGCGVGIKKSDYAPYCSNLKECSYKFNTISLCSGKNNPNVQKCGQYFRVKADHNLADAPDLLYREDGIFVSFCGGMPSPNGSNNAKECDIACEQKNICIESQKMCTADAKLCSDGSYVSRDGNNNCEFKPCPEKETTKVIDGINLSSEQYQAYVIAKQELAIHFPDNKSIGQEILLTWVSEDKNNPNLFVVSFNPNNTLDAGIAITVDVVKKSVVKYEENSGS
jgi:hypothetical protein